MPKFAANLTMLYTDAPFLDRFSRAAASGFSAVEFLFPYPYEAAELQRRVRDAGVEVVLHNLPAGDWEAGERGIAVLPGREREFQDGVTAALRYAGAIGVPRLNCLVGKTPVGVDGDVVHRTLVENLRYAAKALEGSGITLLVEALNTFDIPGFHLTRTAEVLALLDDVACDNVAVQYDVYHAQRMEGELANTLSTHLARIAHVQVADLPGRHEPGTGEINYDFLFAHLDRIGYAGWVGCEYKPAGATEEGLGWLQRWRGNSSTGTGT